jgi:8-amino-7-oxononanoate synthase
MKDRLKKRELQGNRRELKQMNQLIDFASNDYLGLAYSNELLKATLDEQKENRMASNGLGSTGSRLLTGNSYYAEELEQMIADFHGYEAGLLFSNGYMANVGLLSSIATENDCLFFDAHIHASLHDGIRLSCAKAFPFRHNDLEHIERRLKSCQGNSKRYICVESIYSTDGSKAPLKELAWLSTKYEAQLIIDEAHAVGITGPSGRGLVAELNLTNAVFAQVVTFGKALGTYGAIVLGSQLLKEYLINFARSCVYTTALPFQNLTAIKSTYSQFPSMQKERMHVERLCKCFCDAFQGSHAHIQPIKVVGNFAVKSAAERLVAAGFAVSPLMSPSVRQKHETLRVCLHAFNTEEEVARLINILSEMGFSG